MGRRSAHSSRLRCSPIMRSRNLVPHRPKTPELWRTSRSDPRLPRQPDKSAISHDHRIRRGHERSRLNRHLYLEVSFVCTNRNFDQASPLDEWESPVRIAVQCGESKIQFSPQGEPVDSSQKHDGRRTDDGLRNTRVTEYRSGRREYDRPNSRGHRCSPAGGRPKRPPHTPRAPSLEILQMPMRPLARRLRARSSRAKGAARRERPLRETRTLRRKGAARRKGTERTDWSIRSHFQY